MSQTERAKTIRQLEEDPQAWASVFEDVLVDLKDSEEDDPELAVRATALRERLKDARQAFELQGADLKRQSFAEAKALLREDFLRWAAEDGRTLTALQLKILEARMMRTGSDQESAARGIYNRFVGTNSSRRRAARRKKR